MTDEALIERLNEAAHLEMERLNKLKKKNNNKTPKTHELLTSDEPRRSPQTTSVPTKENTKTACTPPEVAALVSELKAEVAEVKQMVLASLNASKSQSAKNLRDDPEEERLQDLKEQRLRRQLHPLLLVWPVRSHLQRMLSFMSA